MKKIIIISILLISAFNLKAQDLYTWSPTVETKWILHHRNDTVLLEPVGVGPNVEVAINCEPGVGGFCFVVMDTEQQCIDYIQDENLKMSENSLANAGSYILPKGVTIINKSDTDVLLSFSEGSSVVLQSRQAMAKAYDLSKTQLNAIITY